MGKFAEGDLIWAWVSCVSRGGPISGVVIRSGLPTPWGTTDRYEVLVGDRMLELDEPRIWATREEAERNPHVVLPSTGRIYPSMIASQMVQVPEHAAAAVSKWRGALWGGNMFGIVLEVNSRRGYVKILTPAGPGWAYRGWVERA